MIDYCYLRWQIYRNELKQMLASFSQFLTFFLLMLYLALPIILLTPLLCLSVIADSSIELSTRISYQWGYFLFVYLLIRIQRSAIHGNINKYYLVSLPTKRATRVGVTVLIALLAGNLPLLAPSLLLLYLPDLQSVFEQLHFVSFALVVLLVAWIALMKMNFPWLSLVWLPLIALLSHNMMAVTPIVLNCVAIGVLIIEGCFSWGKLRLNFVSHVLYYWQIRYLAIKAAPANSFFRCAAVILICLLISYGQQKMQQVSVFFLQIFICWLAALIIGSYQFDNESFKQKHQYYLASLLLSPQYRAVIDIVPACAFTIMTSLFLVYQLHFEVITLLILPAGSLLTLACVNKYQRNFFIIPSAFYLGLLIMAFVA